jgi:hypothetical protein
MIAAKNTIATTSLNPQYSIQKTMTCFDTSDIDLPVKQQPLVKNLPLIVAQFRSTIHPSPK